MTIDEAIKDAEDALQRGACKFVRPDRHLALLRFVQAWDAFHETDDIDNMIAARAAVDEVLQ